VADVVCWLMLIYRVPSEPSRLRTAVWRRLKALGAVYVANSVAVLPESPEAIARQVPASAFRVFVSACGRGLAVKLGLSAYG
jgi:DNA-binding transcriptional regulator PaaX